MLLADFGDTDSWLGDFMDRSPGLERGGIVMLGFVGEVVSSGTGTAPG